jgi:hypothetical protein
MAACPRCARPIALLGPRCLYCGSDLSGIASPPPPAEPTALRLSPLEATRRAELGGFHRHRVASPEDADAEARRLATMGLVAWLIPEAEMATMARPRLVRGGGWEAGGLALEVGGETLRVRSPDLLLVVRGPIVRQYQPGLDLKRLRTATLEDGYRFHLHLVGGGPPLELDPGDFEFAPRDAGYGSSRLVISGWLDGLPGRARNRRGVAPVPRPRRRRAARAGQRRAVPRPLGAAGARRAPAPGAGPAIPS